MIVEIGKALIGYQNQEKIISEFLEANRERRLLDVKLEDGRLLLTFSDKANMPVKTSVKQYSKKKYATVEECIAKMESINSTLKWRVIRVIELPKIWLIFFERSISSI